MKELFGRKYLKPEDLAAMGWEISLFDARALCQALHSLSLYRMEK